MKPQKKSALLRARAALDRKRAIFSTDESPHYLSFRHLDNLFEIDYPAHWKIQKEKDGSVEFFHPSKDEFIGMSIFKTPLHVDSKSIRESGKWEAVAQAMFEKVGSSNVRRDPTIIYENYTADRPEPEQGGRRWFVLAADLILCISTSMAVEATEKWQPVFERMLSSLRVERDDELLAVRIINRAHAKLTSALPDAKIEVKGLKLVTDRFELSIDNLLPQVKRNPAELDEIVDRFVDGLVGMSNTENGMGKETWKEACEKIQPLLKSDKYVQDVNEIMTRPRKDRPKVESFLVSTPWLTDLRICFAIDAAKMFRFVTNLDLNRWQVSVEELAQVAIDNLKKFPLPGIAVGSFGGGYPKIGALTPKGGAAASYMLHPQLFEIASQHLGNKIFAAIPSRDSLMLFEDRGQTEEIQPIVQHDFRQTNHPISDRLFRVTPDGIALL